MQTTTFTNCYEILGVPPDAAPQQIKERYRQLARQLHPDVNREDPAASSRRFVRVTQAYKTLSDPQRRAEHDAEFLTSIAAKEPQQQQQQQHTKPTSQPAATKPQAKSPPTAHEQYRDTHSRHGEGRIAATHGGAWQRIAAIISPEKPRRKGRRRGGRTFGRIRQRERAEMRELLWMISFGWCVLVSAWNLSRFWNPGAAVTPAASVPRFFLWFVLPLLAGIVPCVIAISVLKAHDRADREREEERMRNVHLVTEHLFAARQFTERQKENEHEKH